MTSLDAQPTIITASGVLFDLLEPRVEDVRAFDIAHGLAMKCRWAGHTRIYYSVAEHSVRVSRRCAPEDALKGLLHDAAEAYLGDVPSPLKRRMDGYREIEERLLGVIFARYGLTLPLPASVENADHAELENDRITLTKFIDAPTPRWKRPAQTDLPACFGWWEARARFLVRLHELGAPLEEQDAEEIGEAMADIDAIRRART